MAGSEKVSAALKEEAKVGLLSIMDWTFELLMGLALALLVVIPTCLLFAIIASVFEFFYSTTWSEFFVRVGRAVLISGTLISMIGAICKFVEWKRLKEELPSLISRRNRRAAEAYAFTVLAGLLFGYSVELWYAVNPRIFTGVTNRKDIVWYVYYLIYNSLTLDFFDHFKMTGYTSAQHSKHLSFSIYTYAFRVFCLLVMLAITFEPTAKMLKLRKSNAVETAAETC
jgi:hypothetical protein